MEGPGKTRKDVLCGPRSPKVSGLDPFVCVFFYTTILAQQPFIVFSPTFQKLMMVPGRIVSCLPPSDEVLLTKISFLPVGWQSEVLLPAQSCYSWLPRPLQAEKVLDKQMFFSCFQKVKTAH